LEPIGGSLEDKFKLNNHNCQVGLRTSRVKTFQESIFAKYGFGRAHPEDELCPEELDFADIQRGLKVRSSPVQPIATATIRVQRSLSSKEKNFTIKCSFQPPKVISTKPFKPVTACEN